jgi:hypothetical protein
MTPRLAAAALVAAAICLSLISNADAARKRWDVGLHGGPNVAGIYGVDEDSLGASNRSGFAIGVYMTKWLGDNMGVRLEALYSQKGAVRKERDEPDVTAKLDYIDFPLMLLFSRELTQNKLFGHFYVGPALSLRVNAEFEGPANTSESLSDITTGWDFGGALGLAFAFRAARRLDVTLDLRYTVGFKSIDNTGDDLDYRNNAFSLLVGVESRLGYW